MSHPSYKVRCKPLPAVGFKMDHDVVLLDTTYRPHRARLQRCKLYLWRKADTQGIKQHLQSFSTSFIKSSEHDSSPTDQQPNSIEFMWSKFKDAVTSAVDKYWPTKMSSTHQTHTSVDTKLRRLMRQKHHAHRRAKKTRKRDTGSGTKIYKGMHRKLQGKLKRHTSKRLKVTTLTKTPDASGPASKAKIKRGGVISN